MHYTTPARSNGNKLTASVDPTKIARGHQFMAQLRRGGKFSVRNSHRTQKQRFHQEQ